jgi:hypothetical protein
MARADSSGALIGSLSIQRRASYPEVCVLGPMSFLDVFRTFWGVLPAAYVAASEEIHMTLYDTLLFASPLRVDGYPSRYSKDVHCLGS